jgi:pimeloyl-ACP methyl ester carboxylesterase
MATRPALAATLAGLVLAAAGVADAAVPRLGWAAPPGNLARAVAAWRRQHLRALAGRMDLVRRLTIGYWAHDGLLRSAVLVLPRWYGPHHDPPIPLVISPHGSGIEPQENARRWGNLPALGGFAVINPDGQGRRLELYSWGSQGEIADLARMPAIVREAVPWLRIQRHHVYAIGGSMGGQETLLLLAQHPELLAGAVAFDAPTDMAARYALFPDLPDGRKLQQLARLEFGGIPRVAGEAWADRSPIDYAPEIALSGVPLELWWSRRDQVVVDQSSQSGLLYRAIQRINPTAPVVQVVGGWRHTAEMHPLGRLPFALARIGLLRLSRVVRPSRPG